MWLQRWRTRSDVAIPRSGSSCRRRVSNSAGPMPARMPGEQRDRDDLDEDAGVNRQIEERARRGAFLQHDRTNHVGRAESRALRRTRPGADRFGEQRPNQPRSGCAECRADRGFGFAARPLRDHQNRDVRAGDEQRQQDGRAEDVRQEHATSDRPMGVPLMADTRMLQRSSAGRQLPGIGRERSLQSCGQRIRRCVPSGRRTTTCRPSSAVRRRARAASRSDRSSRRTRTAAASRR